MKTMKLIYAIALATTLAATGCKHEPGKTTPLPGPYPSIVNDQSNYSTIPSPLPYNPDTNATWLPLPEPNPEMFDDMIADRAALANYTVHFKYDSAAIQKSEQLNLQNVAAALGSDANAKLLIEGNCDERGTEEYNRSLGERRALAAREALAKLGVDPMRVLTRSYGKDKPVDPGHDESAWQKNRRDDFVLLHPKPGAQPTPMGMPSGS
jgi:peptidoglycan-associated lipoprotein